MAKKIFTLLTVLFAFFGVTKVNSEELIVKDCKGGLKAAEDVEANSLSTIRLNVMDKAGNFLDGVKVTLSNVSFGEKTSEARDGAVTFREVQAGTWTMCLRDSDGDISRVSIIAPKASAEVTNTSLVVPGVLGVGAVTGIALGLSGGSSGGSDDSEGTLLAGAGNGSLDDISNSPSKPRPSKPAAAKPRPFAGEDCRSDEEPEPVTPFN